ncbi:MAG: hypothetical protein F6K31_09540 [Symploca sp. SIO2G7]|nr:hypothetical protein [Symploca sp. SIO2G7]
MKRLLEQLDAIEAIIDTVNPAQIEQDASSLANRYQLYARSYNPPDRVQTVRDRLISFIEQGKPVNGYFSADYGYGKTATLVYLWHKCQQNQIMAVPPFKFKELENLMVATYGWIKAHIPTKFLSEFEELYQRYHLKSQQEQASLLVRDFKISEKKALQIVQQLKTNTIEPDTILNFWQESVILLQKAGKKGLAIFADETQEFLRTEEGSSVRIQILSDLIKGMRALGSPVALILGMPTVPTESAISEQAGDIIHRMKDQKVSLPLETAYSSEFPIRLWEFLCDQFLDDKRQAAQLAHPATIESLAQLCDRKDLSNGPRTTIEVFKRLVQFVQQNHRPYTPLNLIDDYLAGQVQFYGTGQHRINHTVNTVLQLPSIHKYPQAEQVVKLLAVFPQGLSESVAKDLGLLESLREFVDNDHLYSTHISQLSRERYALTALAQTHTPTIVDKILNQFRQRWFRDWNSSQKQKGAAEIFRSEIMPLLFPPSRSGQKANWTWHYPQKWQEARFGFYNFLTGSPERHYAEFPNRSLVISVGTEPSNLMKFQPPEETHLDWRFYLSYNRETDDDTQKLTAIAGTGQVDFHLQLVRSFAAEYPKSFGLLNKVIPAEQCSACTLLNLSHYIQDWLIKNSEVSKADRERLEQHRRECHQYALRLLFPSATSDNWLIQGLENIQGEETKLVESVFYQKCKILFPNYQSFYNNLRPTLLKYKSALAKVPLAIRRGHQCYCVPKEELESLFETTGSGLPSVLGIFQVNCLISDNKIASKKTDDSQVQFAQHPLEIFMQKKLKTRGKIQMIDTIRGQQDTQTIDVQQLGHEVKRLGYLQEEFEEAVTWLQLRRYVGSNRQSGILYQAIIELDPDVLQGQLNQLRTQVSSLLTAFANQLLLQIDENIKNTETSLQGIAATLAGDGNLDQLNIFNLGVVSSDNRQSLAEVALDEVQRTIQALEKQFEEFCSGKYADLNQELGLVKSRLQTLTRDLMLSKVSQPILGNSGLEVCLDDRRRVLEKQVVKLDKECQKLAESIVLDETDLLRLHRQKEECDKLLASYVEAKNHLSGLVAGLEQWRIILTSAEALRDNLTDNSEQLRRYEDEFVDRVVTHFATHEVESFREYELLQRPLIELTEQLQNERRSRREAFTHLIYQYETLLEQISVNQPSLSILCRFDDENRQDSYETLRQVFLDKVHEGCDRILSQWGKLEQDLIFLAQEREQDVTQLLAQVSCSQTQLKESKEKLSSLIEDLAGLEEQVEKVSAIAQEGEKLQVESIRLQESKDENLTSEEKQLLEKIGSAANRVSLSQLRQLASESDKIWEQIKTLYRKGHLDIIVNRRE